MGCWSDPYRSDIIYPYVFNSCMQSLSWSPPNSSGKSCDICLSFYHEVSAKTLTIVMQMAYKDSHSFDIFSRFFFFKFNQDILVVNPAVSDHMSIVLPLTLCMPHNLSLHEWHFGSFLVQVFQQNIRFPFIISTSDYLRAVIWFWSSTALFSRL